MVARLLYTTITRPKTGLSCDQAQKSAWGRSWTIEAWRPVQSFRPAKIGR